MSECHDIYEWNEYRSRPAREVPKDVKFDPCHDDYLAATPEPTDEDTTNDEAAPTRELQQA